MTKYSHAGLASVVLGATLLSPALGDAADPLVERGRYLTHDVAMCVQCHTPRDANGALIAEQEFMGAPFPLTPPPFLREEAWCISTPRIAGMPGFTQEEAVSFLMNGARLGIRHQPKWPMPPFRMTRDDAEAVVAYLRSIGGGVAREGYTTALGR